MAEHTPRLAIIGCGFMGSAILQGLLQHDATDEPSNKLQYTAHVHSSASMELLKQTFSAHSSAITFTHGDSQLTEAVSSADIVLLGFVPGDLDTVLSTDNFASHLRGKIIISMLAGISTSQLLAKLVSATPGSRQDQFDIARTIPTLGAKIGESVTLIAETPTPSAAIPTVAAVFKRIGSVHHVPEKSMDTATAINAAVHALAIVAVDSAVDASVADGMPRAAALALTAQCLQSCSALMTTNKGGMTPESVKSAMSTPAGITLNSIVHLDAHVRPGIASTVRNAVKYTKSMND
ncbi:uncharacterized protein RCC_01732 [Ramularia collo-cygni]|uniref:Pyrroline-5-carboxylate reductase n=1 Tax=Ramularia collo-cygni TaxID=112498 RepID=A0A2D3V6F5_9PEZI|nr:uncharacterized protein RCC_01732 [Ramularia collo-cygni]CZT15893.1 uncharacterized protein RCC_01732 [Ramularia collo-cygni]